MKNNIRKKRLYSEQKMAFNLVVLKCDMKLFLTVILEKEHTRFVRNI